MKTRICKCCGKTICYKTNSHFNYAERRNASCYECSQSKMRMGKNNSFYGKKHSNKTKNILALIDKSYTKTKAFSNSIKRSMKGIVCGGNAYEMLKNKHGETIAKKIWSRRNKKLAELFSGNKNPMYGRPSPQGSGSGWKGWYGGIFFRSIRELMFLIEISQKCFRKADSKDFMIPYTDPMGKSRNYFPDFLVDNKYLYEIKPKKLWNTPLVKCKKMAAEKFCSEQNLTYILYDPKIDFKTLSGLDRDGKIKWMGNYGEKFRSFKEK